MSITVSPSLIGSCQQEKKISFRPMTAGLLLWLEISKECDRNPEERED